MPDIFLHLTGGHIQLEGRNPICVCQAATVQAERPLHAPPLLSPGEDSRAALS